MLILLEGIPPQLKRFHQVICINVAMSRLVDRGFTELEIPIVHAWWNPHRLRAVAGMPGEGVAG